MRRFPALKVFLVWAVAVFTCTPILAQSAFQLQLTNLEKAISDRERYDKEARKAEFLDSIPEDVRTQLGLQAAAPSGENGNRAIGTALTDIVDTIVTGTATVYTGAGLTQLNVQIQKTESTWKSDHLRNGFDKAKPIFDIAGNILVGASLVLTSQKNQPGGAKASGVVGVVALATGSLLQHFLGSKTSQLDKSAGTVNGISVDIAQLEFSRAAYDDLDLRYKVAKGYYDNAKALLPDLRDILARCKSVRDNPTAITDDNLRKLIDDVSAARDKYEKLSDFVDAYTKQLGDAYVKYEGSYPLLKSQLDPLIAQIQSFQADFQTDVGKAFLADFPKFKSMLIDLRAKVGT